MPSARISLDGAKIVLSGYSPELLEFYRSLPTAKWHANERVWTCDLTPGSALRVCQRIADCDIKITLSAHVVRDEGNQQPPRRHHDSWRHQVAAYQFAHRADATMLAMDMGTGKSKVAVDLIVNWDAQRVLILCPVSVRAVWRREFLKHGPMPPPRVLVLEKGDTKLKAATAELFLKRGPGVVVVNYETARLDPFAKWSLSVDWDVVVLDESHRCKGPNTAVSKYVARLSKAARRRLCLTGTPMPHSPLDLFGQYKFLDAGVFGTSWHHFRNHFAISGPFGMNQIVAYKNQDELNSRFGLLAYRVGKEVLDLPEALHHERTFTLGPMGRKAYDELEQELITDLGNGKVATAANALVRLLRLQQVTSGFLVEDDTKREVLVDHGKRDVLKDLLEDLPDTEPVVVFCRFRHDLAVVRAVADELGRAYGELSGSQKDLDERAMIPPQFRIFAVQIQSGGLGVDFTAARYCIYYSLGFSLGDYEQSLARLHRPGQTRAVHYYHLIADDTVDVKVYDALRKRKDLVEAVLESLKERECAYGDCS